MKRLLALLAMIFLITTVQSQNITKAEYFFDTDPGVGNGSPITISSPADIVNFSANIPTSLSPGFHFLAIRVRDANGLWGLFEKRGFYVTSAAADAANIVAAEYFFDADPGAGNGTPTSVGASGAVVNFTAVIPTSLSAGFHFLAIRVKDANGIWGLYEKRGFYVSSSAANAANIVAAEYFFDTDSGAGNGTATSIGASGAVVNFTATIPTSVGPGFHFLAIRVKDANGIWGLYEKRGFYVSSSAADAANIVAAEYFFDADPGAGNGTATSIGATGAVVNFTATIPASLSPGFHFLSIRTKGADGVWGLYEKRGFYISTSAADASIIVAAEYFFDADPGAGNGTALAVTTPGNIVTQTFNIPLPGNMPGGNHLLAIRVKNQTGNWGLFESRTFTVNGASITCPSNTTVSAPAGQCTAVVNNIDPVITPQGSSFTYTLTGATTGNGSGTASGQTFNAGVTTVTYALSSSPDVNCSFTVTVNTNVVPSVSIGANPGNTICAGTNVTFTATPTNGGTPSYQWKLNGNNVGTNSNTYQNSTLVNGDVVTCVMTSSLSCANPTTAISNAITMTVTGSVTPSVSIGANPGNTICSGTNVTFTTTPTNGGTPSYQWKLNSNNVGTNSNTYQNAALMNGDVITVVMTSSIACANPTTATSNVITMTVTSNVNPSVSIGASPGNNICSGTNVTFTATPTNGGTPSYQWKLNGTNVGTNSNTYQNSTLVNGDVVTCVMTSSLNCASPNPATSNAITITVSGNVTPSVSIGASPGSTICSGTNVTFTATPTNGGTPSYQWKLNGTNVGTNSNTYQNSTLVNGDVVTCVLTSSLACANPTTATSNAITITVSGNVTPSITIGASPGNTICAGTNVTFTATPANGGTPSYQWKLNGNNVGTNSNTYQNSALANGDVVTCVMTSSLACASPTTATSNAITMTVTANVNPSVSIGASPGNTICAGTNVTFTATPANGGTPTYQWKLNGNNVGTNSNTYQNSMLVNGDVVTCVMTSSLACASPNPVTSNSITITVTTVTTFYRDADGDGYGNTAISQQACTAPAGYVSTNTDCDDNNAAVHPGAVEVCGNSIDDNCNGQVDENCTTNLPSIVLRTYPLKEGDVGNTVYDIEVKLDHPAPLPVRVDFSTSDDDAIAALDYVAVKGVLTIPPGATSGIIHVTIIGDLLRESNERFWLNFSNPINVIVDGDSRSRIMILDDDKGRGNNGPVTLQMPVQEDRESKLIIPNITRRNSVWRIPSIMNMENKIEIINANGQVILKADNYRNNIPIGNVATGLYFYRIKVVEKDNKVKYYSGKLLITE